MFKVNDIDKLLIHEHVHQSLELGVDSLNFVGALGLKLVVKRCNGVARHAVIVGGDEECFESRNAKNIVVETAGNVYSKTAFTGTICTYDGECAQVVGGLCRPISWPR